MESQNCSFFTDSLSPDESLDEDQYLLRHSSPALDHDSPCGQHMLLAHLEHQDQEQLQCTLARLENENRVLQSEYRRLKWKHEEAASVPMLTEAGEGGPGSPTEGGPQDEELLAEARVLRQHKTRLETRMQILEDHNKQLESQLRRLRELLLQKYKRYPKMTRRPTDQSRRPCLLPCLVGGVTTESMRAERPPTLKQQEMIWRTNRIRCCSSRKSSSSLETSSLQNRAPPHTSNTKWAWRSRMKTCKGRLMAEGGAPYG
ncbi:dystrophin-related protein 2-like isoform X1 [Notothenia coriiceps]|uniref:Dystrophin-related protein 2-like isoform X1 n=1 Tax=Notothenia coriiceps TaxID=8208 RepID=A0A6I9PD89_9TELE|nr:PREDICTED: dystrophin-related protein 2-like isoform X1 [Notothenia coriiceps]